eukprot:jgi/Botrbrau1/2381/Bobra.0395s0013.2
MELGRPWVLENRQGTKTHMGTLEGGLSGPNANYFLLVKEGRTFKCVPLPLWYNFRPAINHKVMDLEEAEAYMERRERQTFALPTRLGAAIAKAEEAGPEEVEDEDGRQEDDSEEEEEKRAARARGSGTAAARPVGEESGRQENVAGTGGPKREDWEHTQEAADDDINMEGSEGEEAEDEHDTPNQEAGRREGAASPSGSGSDGSPGPRSLRKALARQSREGGSASPSRHSSEEEEDEVDDLDEMAMKMSPKALPAKEAKGGRGSQPPSGSKSGKPGKPTTEPLLEKDTRVGSGKRSAESPEADSAPKRAKTEKNGATSSTPGGTAAPPVGTPLQVLEREIREWLLQTGAIPVQDLTAKFKRKLKNDEQMKKDFFVAVRKVAKLEERPPGSGNKMVVLRGS